MPEEFTPYTVQRVPGKTVVCVFSLQVHMYLEYYAGLTQYANGVWYRLLGVYTLLIDGILAGISSTSIPDIDIHIRITIRILDHISYTSGISIRVALIRIYTITDMSTESDILREQIIIASII